MKIKPHSKIDEIDNFIAKEVGRRLDLACHILDKVEEAIQLTRNHIREMRHQTNEVENAYQVLHNALRKRASLRKFKRQNRK